MTPEQRALWNSHRRDYAEKLDGQIRRKTSNWAMPVSKSHTICDFKRTKEEILNVPKGENGRPLQYLTDADIFSLPEMHGIPSEKLLDNAVSFRLSFSFCTLLICCRSRASSARSTTFAACTVRATRTSPA